MEIDQPFFSFFFQNNLAFKGEKLKCRKKHFVTYSPIFFIIKNPSHFYLDFGGGAFFLKKKLVFKTFLDRS